MPSYREINYSLRPAKLIERKMLAEAFWLLSPFGAVSAYRYVGLGSIYFSDFSLFHKALGITNMISIEKDIGNKPRFDFNSPFKCIKIKFGLSTAILPTLQWDMRTILWLDYDGQLDASKLSDIGFFCTNADKGSVLIVSVNVHPEFPKISPGPLEQLKETVGEAKVPADLEDNQLMGWGKAAVCRNIITNEIEEIVSARNGERDPGSKFLFKQLFNFNYADDARMLTVGGILYDEGQAGTFAACGFDKLDFYRGNEEPYMIEVPKLTYAEIRELNTQLPCDPTTKLKGKSIPDTELEQYRHLYRYFPKFADADL
jgi:hypothetical protein